MTDLSHAPRARLFTVFGTVLYVDAASGHLRHGPVETCPANAVFVAEPGWGQPHRKGRLVQEKADSLEPIVCLPDHCQTASSMENGGNSAAGTLLELVPLERGLIAFTANGLYLMAGRDGMVSLSRPICSTWECYLASEHWCTDGADNEQLLATENAMFDRKRIQDYVIHPLIRKRANAKSTATKVLIYGYPQWSHGRVYYDLCKHLHRRGYIADIINWRGSHSAYFADLISFYDLFMTALDGVRTLTDVYGVPCDRVVALSHHELDIRTLIDQKGVEVFDKFANYGVVSEYVYCASLMKGVPRVPKVVPLGVNFAEFYSNISERLATVGYAGSMSVNTYGIEWKRGELAEAAAHEAGLEFRVAGSTAKQISFHDMPEFYRSVDAVLISSISESGPLTVMEAAAAGRLVIGTPVGHFPRKAYEGGGILAPIEAGEFKAFTVETLRYYKDNPAAYQDKCHAIQEAARRFDWKYTIDEWVDLIEAARPPGERKQRTRRASGLYGASLSVSSLGKAVQKEFPQVSPLNQIDLEHEFRSLQAKGFHRTTDLCEIMASFGSDKSRPFHNYTVVYDWLFSRFRKDRLSIFELGLGTNKVGAPSSMGAEGRPGASLRGWREYFPSGEIYGADIDADILFSEDRIRTFWTDQRDPRAIRALWDQIGEIAFDIIVEDGLHEASASICFFAESFGKLKPGGIYVIEDVGPKDVELLTAFTRVMSCVCKCVIFEELDHPKNKIDNRLVICQKA